MSTIKVSQFSQLTSLPDRQWFAKRLDTVKHSKGLGRWPHLISMVILHLAKVHPISDISNSVQTSHGNPSYVSIE